MIRDYLTCCSRNTFSLYPFFQFICCTKENELWKKVLLPISNFSKKSVSNEKEKASKKLLIQLIFVVYSKMAANAEATYNPYES